ncbi:hypothetical protein THF5H11_120004 [Vibrio jasicida]|nr:hypothetical protein THF5H11_120004 [Vibrio jasicida]CAH1605798.1 hypothetical protein THF5G08_170096 [Vibrio jasicida]
MDCLYTDLMRAERRIGQQIDIEESRYICCSGLTSEVSLDLALVNFNTFFKQVFNIVRWCRSYATHNSVS